MSVSLKALLVFVVAVAATPAQDQHPKEQSLIHDVKKSSIITDMHNSIEVTTVVSSDSTSSSAEGSGEEEPISVDRQALLRHPHAVLFGRTCGGTIISPTWVISAGHCLIFTSGRSVLAGASRSNDGSGEVVQVKRIIIHPKFSVGPYFLKADSYNISQVAGYNDYLLVELANPLNINNVTIKIATLDDRLNTPVNANVSYAGYGTDHFQGYMRNTLHEMELKVLPDVTCTNRFIEYDPDVMMCTVGRPPRFDSACNGDSGSGLVDETGRLLGVASWVERDAVECKNGNIVVFSRVAAVRQWIRKVTGI